MRIFVHARVRSRRLLVLILNCIFFIGKAFKVQGALYWGWGLFSRPVTQSIDLTWTSRLVESSPSTPTGSRPCSSSCLLGVLALVGWYMFMFYRQKKQKIATIIDSMGTPTGHAMSWGPNANTKDIGHQVPDAL